MLQGSLVLSGQLVRPNFSRGGRDLRVSPRCRRASPALCVTAAGLPNAAEDKDAMHSSFVKAYHDSQSDLIKIPGLQEFASAVWERRKRIPTANYKDPLDHLFTEFDQDSDGHLTAAEVAAALQSRGVQISEQVAQLYIDAADGDGNGQVERHEFGNLIYRMAVANLNGKVPQPKNPLKKGRSLKDLKLFQYVLEKDPSLLHIPGLQELAASVWDRRRRVPAQVWHDPLEAAFEEFDADGDGHLTAQELVAALASREVHITLLQAQLVVDAVDHDQNGTIEKEEFPALIYGLATLDRLSRGMEAASAVARA